MIIKAGQSLVVTFKSGDITNITVEYLLRNRLNDSPMSVSTLFLENVQPGKVILGATTNTIDIRNLNISTDGFATVAMSIVQDGVSKAWTSGNVSKNKDAYLDGDVVYYEESYSNDLTLQLSSADSASKNTKTIQAALDSGKDTTFIMDSPVLINSTLIYRGGVIRGLKVKQAPNTNKNMMVNQAYLAPGTNITLAWTSGRRATVTWTAHGKKQGDYVSIYDVSPSQYIGCFRIHSVTDANNFLVVLERIPTVTPTALNGSVKVKNVDLSPTLLDCYFDYDRLNNAAPVDIKDNHAIIFGHVANPKIDIVVDNAGKYCFNVGAVSGGDIKVLANNTNSDIVKIYGPAFNVKGRSAGRCGDDAISVQTRETNAFSGNRWTYGDIIGCDISADAVASASLCVIYLSQNEYVDNVNVSFADGLCDSNSVKIQGDIDISTDAAGQFGNIFVNSVSGTGANNPTQASQVSTVWCTGEYLRINGVRLNRIGSTDPGIKLLGAIKNTHITGVTEMPGLTAANYHVDASTTGGIVTIENCSSYRSVLVTKTSTTAAPSAIIVKGCYVNGTQRVAFPSPGTPRTNFIFKDSYFNVNHVSRSDNVLGNTFVIRDCIIENAFEGLVRANAPAAPVTVKASGITPLGTTIVSATRVVGTEVLTIDGSEIRIDLSTIARTDGAIVYNTNAALGTLGAAGLCVCQGTAALSWKLMSDPTKSY